MLVSGCVMNHPPSSITQSRASASRKGTFFDGGSVRAALISGNSGSHPALNIIWQEFRCIRSATSPCRHCDGWWQLSRASDFPVSSACGATLERLLSTTSNRSPQRQHTMEACELRLRHVSFDPVDSYPYSVSIARIEKSNADSGN